MTHNDAIKALLSGPVFYAFSDVVELAADVVRVVAELRGHVAELDGRWQNNADLAAEVARLTAREREAAGSREEIGVLVLREVCRG